MRLTDARVSAWFHAVGERRGRRVDHERATRSAGRAAGRVSTTIDVDAGERAERAQRVGPTRPRTATTRSTRRCARRFSSTVGEAVVGVGADGGEPVDHVVARVAAGAEDLARAGDHLDPPPQPHEPRDDRRRGLDRDLERLGVVAVRVHVEHDRGARPPPRFVLADHQLAGARGRAPVHAAQVVADLVVAQGEELVAEVAHHRARAAVASLLGG